MSKILKDTLAEFAKQFYGDPKPAATGERCKAYQASDGMYCACGLSWDVNDPDPPVCPATGRPGPQNGARRP